jgi:hypothetical protein
MRSGLVAFTALAMAVKASCQLAGRSLPFSRT